MQNLILVVHIIACIVITGLVLIQKSEGGGLGIGGGGGGAGSLMSGRGTAGALVRSTIMFAGVFFITSLALTTIANHNKSTVTDVERALGADDDTGATGPVDLLDPTAPLFESEDSAATTDAVEASDAPTELIDPTANPVTEAPAEEPAGEADTGNPQ